MQIWAVISDDIPWLMINIVFFRDVVSASCQRIVCARERLCVLRIKQEVLRWLTPSKVELLRKVVIRSGLRSTHRTGMCSSKWPCLPCRFMYYNSRLIHISIDATRHRRRSWSLGHLSLRHERWLWCLPELVLKCRLNRRRWRQTERKVDCCLAINKLLLLAKLALVKAIRLGKL